MNGVKADGKLGAWVSYESVEVQSPSQRKSYSGDPNGAKTLGK
jgi:hypothetical protein